MLEKEFKYYLKHQKAFVKKYEGKYLVIKNQKIIGVYGSNIEAYTETIKKHELGTFLIQLCSPGDKDIAITFHSRAIFA